MTTFGIEPVSVLQAEAGAMFEAHYEELTRHKDVVKLEPNWRVYDALYRSNRLYLFTIRDDAGRLVGYSTFVVDYHLHYASLLVATNDLFYIHPDYRRGPTALRFLRLQLKTLKDMGVNKIAFHCKRVNNLCAILRTKRLGFEDEEEVVGKII